MENIQITSLNSALLHSLMLVNQQGEKRETRGFICYEAPEPVTIKLYNPSDRYVTLPERKWNKILPFAEFIWLMLGLNDLDSLPGTYVKNLYNFSDDNKSWRAGYGPRLRNLIGFNSDRVLSEPKHSQIFSSEVGSTDQLKFIIESLKRDINTRQAVIDIGYPLSDNWNQDGTLKTTKDQPCTRILNFQMRSGRLDLTVYMRSNDIIWGMSSVNIFNFTTIQEVVAAIVGVPVGNYYHVANNLHYYDDMSETVGNILNSGYKVKIRKPYYYNWGSGVTLEEFDSETLNLWEYERALVRGEIFPFNFPKFKYDFHKDFFTVFWNKWKKEKKRFINPYLNNLFYGEFES